MRKGGVMGFGYDDVVEKNVEVFKGNESVVSGKLTFGKLKGIVVFFANDLLRVNALSAGETYDQLVLKDDGGDFYTIINCTVEAFSIEAELILEGRSFLLNKAKLYVRYNVVSRWFNDRNGIDSSSSRQDRVVTWSANQEQFEVEVLSVDKPFSVKSSSANGCQRVNEDFVIHEHVNFCIEPIGCEFSIIEFKDRVHELLVYFVIVMGMPADVNSIYLRNGDGDVRDGYFPAFVREPNHEYESAGGLYAFLTADDVKDHWHESLSNYFSVAMVKRRDLWLRLAGMKSYKGFWEYEVLGYFFLLEAYVDSVYVADMEKSKVKPKNLKLKEDMKEYAKTLPSEYKDKVLEFANRLSVKEIGPSFMDKYRYAVSVCNKEVVEIISLSDSGVKFVMGIRNKIAHGDKHNLSKGDFAKVGVVMSKIVALLTCWAYDDFGLNGKALKFLLHSHNRLIFRAKLNIEARDRISNQAKFINVSVNDFERAKSLDSVFVSQGGNYVLCEKLSERLVEWRNVAKPGRIDWNSVFSGVDEDAEVYEMEFCGKAYLSCIDAGEE